VSEAVLYLDSSAIIKLVFEELETSSLSDFLQDWPTRASSTVASVEVLRATTLVGDDLVTRHARAILTHLHLVRPDDGLLAIAARIEPPLLRALDAIHLATALSLGHDLGGMVVYDRRLADAARGAGLTFWSPR